MIFWAEGHDCSLVDAFKFFFRLTWALDHDAAIEKIMDTLHAIRDENEINFKTALEHAMEKRKFLIQRMLKEEVVDDDSDDNDDDNESPNDDESQTGDLNV